MCRQGSQTLLALFKGRKSRIDTLFKAQNPKKDTLFKGEKDNARTAIQLAINVLLNRFVKFITCIRACRTVLTDHIFFVLRVGVFRYCNLGNPI